MKDLIGKLLEEIPKYMGHFVQSLANPKGFLQENFTVKSHREIIERSLSFVILSLLIVFVLSEIFPATLIAKYSSGAEDLTKLVGSDNRFIQFVTDVLSGSFELLALSAITYFAWRLVGIKPNFQQCFGFTSYLISIALVLGVFIQAIPNIAQIDPVVGRGLVELESTTQQLKTSVESLLCNIDPHTGEITGDISNSVEFSSGQIPAQEFQAKWSVISGRPIYRMTEGLQILARVALFVWEIQFWFAFGKIQGASFLQIITNIGVTFVGFMFILLFSTIIETNAYLMQIYRNC